MSQALELKGSAFLFNNIGVLESVVKSNLLPKKQPHHDLFQQPLVARNIVARVQSRRWQKGSFRKPPSP